VVTLNRLTCAAPSYLERFGMPATIDSLDGHRMIGLRSLSTGNTRPMEFIEAGKLRTLTLPTSMSVTGTESYLATARLGLGLVQIPQFHGAVDLERGTLVQVLADVPPPSVPVSLLYPRNRLLTARVRVFLDWAAREFAARGEA
jgi:DNA-binding transcriptional LysR family regulator